MKKKKQPQPKQPKRYWTPIRITIWACLYIGTFFIVLAANERRTITTLAEERFHPAVTKVSSYQGGHGTGFFTKTEKSTYLITASHVCAGDTFLFSNWGVHTILAIDVYYEICVLDASTTMSTVTLSPTGPNLNGEIWIIGFPLNYSWRETRGEVTRLEIVTLGIPFNKNGLCDGNAIPFIGRGCMTFYNGFETSAEVLPGNSGGPVFSKKGLFGSHVVGLVIALHSFTRKGYFVSSEDILKVLEKNKL